MMNRRNFTRPEPSRTNVTAVVKWYNPAKGFGFVQPSDGSPDAFLHASVVEQSGHRAILEGSTIVCDLSEGQKGPQVTEIHNVDTRSEEHTSELQSLMRISYAVFCLKKKTKQNTKESIKTKQNTHNYYNDTPTR